LPHRAAKHLFKRLIVRPDFNDIHTQSSTIRYFGSYDKYLYVSCNNQMFVLTVDLLEDDIVRVYD